MPENLRAQVGERLRQLRRLADLTQEELAARADTSAKYVSEVELGKQNVSLDYLSRFARALDVQPYSLLVPAKTRDPARLKRQAVARYLDRLDDRAWDFICEVVNAYIAHARK